MNAISTGGPEGQVMGMAGGTVVASSFGIEQTTMGANAFSAQDFIMSDRVVMLGRRQSQFRGTSHDWKMYDFDGRAILPGPSLTQPLISAEQTGYFVPLRQRRPPVPYRLARVIVNTFTALMFGRGRWPTIRVHGDPKTEKFARSCEKAAKLRRVMVRARAIGGSSGTVGLSWKYVDGLPRVNVHNPKHLYVHEWADVESFVPGHVSEVYTYSRDCYDPESRKVKTKWFWYRRDWTLISDVAYEEIPFEANVDPQWKVCEKHTLVHNDGFAHFVWIQNVPEEDNSSIDGQPDYAELYESLDSLDILKSVVVKGATLNLDPTLVLKVDPEIMTRVGIKKGSDNSIMVGEAGNAMYLELSGTSIESGCKLLKFLRDAILESAQCVVPDPNLIGASGTSSVALKVIYEPSLAKCDIMREPYGEGITRLLQQMIDSARNLGVGVPVDHEVLDENGESILDENGSPKVEQVIAYVALPPEVITIKQKDLESGDEVEITKQVDLEPGDGGEIELIWGEYFNPTADDKHKAVATIQIAVVTRIMSQQSGTEEVASVYGRNPRDEVARIEKQLADDDARRTAEMFPGGGGEIPDTQKMPSVRQFNEGEKGDDKGDAQTGVAPGTPMAAGAKAGSADPIEAGVDAAKLAVKVNEWRRSRGLDKLTMPDGTTPDPDGELVFTEFEAKRVAQGKAVGELVGAAVGQSEVAQGVAAPVV